MNQLQKHWTWLKWVVALSVMTFLVVQYRTQFQQLAEREISFGFLVMALGLCAASIVLTFIRWYLLVWAQEFPFTVGDALRLGFIGYLFNYVAPGAAGGDLVKAVMIAREQNSRRAVAVATVLLDRILGLLALFIVGAAATLMTRDLWGNREVQIIIAVLVAGSVIGSLGVGLMLWPPFVHSKLVAWFQRLPAVGRLITEIVRGVALYQQRPRIVLLAVGISIVGHLGMLSSFYFCSLALQSGAAAPGYWQHLMLIPGAELAGVLIPLPGGVGALEGAIMYVYGVANRAAGMLVDANAAEAAGLFTAIAYRVVCVVVAAVGAGYYLTGRRQIEAVLEGESHAVDSANRADSSPDKKTLPAE